MSIPYKGSCLCGTVFIVEGEIADVTHCHCSMCRKAHGAAYGTYGYVPVGTHRFTQGEPSLSVYRSSETVERMFCSVCGSPMLWRDQTHFPGIVSFPLGALDTEFTAPRQRHIFVASMAPWHKIVDQWPQSQLWNEVADQWPQSQ